MSDAGFDLVTPPSLEIPIVTLDALRTYADASGDHAAIHLDAAVAQRHGFPAPIAHGLLAMGWLTRTITDHYRADEIVGISVRFLAPVLLGTALRATAEIVSKDGDRLDLSLLLATVDGQPAITGSATIRLTGVEEAVRYEQ